MCTDKKNQIIKIINMVLIISFFICSFYLFYNQSIDHEGKIFVSDLKAHMRSGRNGGGYSLMTKIFYMLFQIRTDTYLIALCIALIAVGTVFTTYWSFKLILSAEKINANNHWIFLASILMQFVCTVYVPVIYPHFYSGSACTQSWHNSTYLLMRLFAVPTFGLYVSMEKGYLQEISWKDGVIFTVLLILGNWSKPSFLITFALVMLWFLIVDFIKTRTKGTIQIIKFGIPVLLSLPVCFHQSNSLWKEGSGNGVRFNPQGVIDFLLHYDYSVICYFIFGLLFPIVATVVYLIKKGENRRILIQGWMLYIIAFIEHLTLKEYGKRENSGNFGWGRKIGGFVLFMVCIVKMIELYKADKIDKRTFYMLMLVYCLGVVSGIVYFGLLLTGRTYKQ